MRTNPFVPHQIEQSSGVSTKVISSVLAAEATYALLISALLIAEKEETPGAAERCREIALAAEAYFPLTRLEKPSWVPDTTEIPAAVANG